MKANFLFFSQGYTFPFKKPVDTAALGLADYHEVIKKPMDLMTMKKKLIGEEYDTAVEFKEDFKLVSIIILTVDVHWIILDYK